MTDEVHNERVRKAHYGNNGPATERVGHSRTQRPAGPCEAVSSRESTIAAPSADRGPYGTGPRARTRCHWPCAASLRVAVVDREKSAGAEAAAIQSTSASRGDVRDREASRPLARWPMSSRPRDSGRSGGVDAQEVESRAYVQVGVTVRDWGHQRFSQEIFWEKLTKLNLQTCRAGRKARM